MAGRHPWRARRGGSERDRGCRCAIGGGRRRVGERGRGKTIGRGRGSRSQQGLGDRPRRVCRGNVYYGASDEFGKEHRARVWEEVEPQPGGQSNSNLEGCRTRFGREGDRRGGSYRIESRGGGGPRRVFQPGKSSNSSLERCRTRGGGVVVGNSGWDRIESGGGGGPKRDSDRSCAQR